MTVQCRIDSTPIPRPLHIARAIYQTGSGKPTIQAQCGLSRPQMKQIVETLRKVACRHLDVTKPMKQQDGDRWKQFCDEVLLEPECEIFQAYEDHWPISAIMVLELTTSTATAKRKQEVADRTFQHVTKDDETECTLSMPGTFICQKTSSSPGAESASKHTVDADASTQCVSKASRVGGPQAKRRELCAESSAVAAFLRALETPLPHLITVFEKFGIRDGHELSVLARDSDRDEFLFSFVECGKMTRWELFKVRKGLDKMRAAR